MPSVSTDNRSLDKAQTSIKPCRDCQDYGRTVLASRILPSKTAVCEMHYRQRLRLPALPGTASSPMISEPHVTEDTLPKNSQIDWTDVQQARNSGTSTKDLAAKFGCEVWAIYQNTKGSGRKAAGGGNARPAKTPRAAVAAAVPQGSLLERARTELEHHEYMAKQLREVVRILVE